MTSLFRELVSVPTWPCFSIRTVEAESRCWSLRAMASPITPPPMTAWVKSAFRGVLEENFFDFEMVDLNWRVDRERARNEVMMYLGKTSGVNDENQHNVLQQRQRRVNNTKQDQIATGK